MFIIVIVFRPDGDLGCHYIFVQLLNYLDVMMEKDNTKMRCIDKDGYRERAACICVKNEREDEVRINYSLKLDVFFVDY